MDYDNLIFIINASLVVILLMMALLLCIAARFKGDSSYAALFIFFTTIPDFIYYTCDTHGWHEMVLLTAPFAYSANLTIMPFLLLLAHRAFNPFYHFKWSTLLHFVPAAGFATVVATNIMMMTPDDVRSFSVVKIMGFTSMLSGLNFVIITIQLAVYFYLIFRYLRKVKRYILNTRSEAHLLSKKWVPRFISLIGALIVVAMLYSRFQFFGGFQLFYLINVIVMSFLLYSELQILFTIRHTHISPPQAATMIESDFVTADIKANSKAEIAQDDLALLNRYAEQVQDYLTQSEAYLNPNLSLNEVAKATGISTKNLSRAINTALGKNFFDLINNYRVEKSKTLLTQKKERGLTLETIAEQCGFNSQVTYCNAFKRTVGTTTSQWLKQQRNT